MVKPGDGVRRSDSRNRNHKINVRVSDDERRTIQRRAYQHGYDCVGEYVRASAIGGHKIERRDIGRAIGHLGKIGSNLNQIAKVANSDRSTQNIDPYDARAVLDGVHDAVDYLTRRADGQVDDTEGD